MLGQRSLRLSLVNWIAGEVPAGSTAQRCEICSTVSATTVLPEDETSMAFSSDGLAVIGDLVRLLMLYSQTSGCPF